ncbi:MAG: phosphate acetyltransferase [Deltaproteobacteria bacterium]|nr:phosphate acetyltransferase [Deltaproteobacteria bacterium]
MAKNLYIASTESRSGKSAICLGIMELLVRNIGRVGFFRPVIRDKNGKPDNDINLISKYFKLDIAYDEMYGCTTTEANELIALGKQDELIERIFTKYNRIESNYDFVLCEGTDFEGSTSSLEFTINAEVAKNLGCPVLLVASAHNKTPSETFNAVEAMVESLQENGCKLLSIIVNRANPSNEKEIITYLERKYNTEGFLIYTIPNEKYLGNPTIGEIVEILNARVLYGHDQLDRHAHNIIVAAMQLRNFLKGINYGTLVITPGDRGDVIIACLASVSSLTMPAISGILLTGGLRPEETICKLIEGLTNIVPIISVETDTFNSARMVDNIHAVISPANTRKITRALELFEKNVSIPDLTEKIIETQTTTITPKMFEYGLIQKAKIQKQHIVLPEGEDERVLRAAEILLRREVVKLTLLGNEDEIKKKMMRLGLHLEGADIIDTNSSKRSEEYAETYFELRKHKGITKEMARDIMKNDVSFFGTMMVHKGHADGLVSGAVHTTQATVRPAFEIIKTKPGISIVSSIFFMCMSDRVLVYGDCAVNPDPSASQLAEIAINSAQTAKIFGINPIVAMLSYSTGESGKGENVEKVREATKIAKKLSEEHFPGLNIEGPLQYDAAVDPEVAAIKMPDSEVAGKATVFIFPDLNTGNNTYKAVQRTAGAVAVGPVLQGLKMPVNDLSRGCSVTDIVNTVAITAIQALGKKGLI